MRDHFAPTHSALPDLRRPTSAASCFLKTLQLGMTGLNFRNSDLSLSFLFPLPSLARIPFRAEMGNCLLMLRCVLNPCGDIFRVHNGHRRLGGVRGWLLAFLPPISDSIQEQSQDVPALVHAQARRTVVSNAAGASRKRFSLDVWSDL